jgi:hemolysin activation/secretion protein
MWMTLGCKSLWLIVAAGMAAPAAAQQMTDAAAQELLRQQERERVLREQQETRPDVRLEREVENGIERLPAEETPCFRIDRIVLEGEAPAISSGPCAPPALRGTLPRGAASVRRASTW